MRSTTSLIAIIIIILIIYGKCFKPLSIAVISLSWLPNKSPEWVYSTEHSCAGSVGLTYLVNIVIRKCCLLKGTSVQRYPQLEMVPRRTTAQQRLTICKQSHLI